MLKNLKLGSKTVGGFIIVLILLAVVAYVGYNGLSGVADRVVKADDVNRLIKLMLATRQQEKNFIIRGDKEYVDKVQDDVADIKKQAKETRDKFEDPANKRQMDDVLTAIGQYERAFAEYVDFQAAVDAADAKMVKGARDALEVAEEMRQEQKAEYATLREANAEAAKLDDKLTKADDSNRIIKWILEARRQEKNFILRGDKQYIDKVHELVEEVLNLARDMKSRFRQAKNQQQVNQVIAATQAYKAAFDDVVTLKGKQEKADSAMVAAARATQEVCDRSRADQKAKMET